MKKRVVALAAGNLAIGLAIFQLWSDLRAVRLQTFVLNDRFAARSAKSAAELRQPMRGSEIAAKTAEQLSHPLSPDAAARDRETYVKALRAAMANAEDGANAMLRERMPERYPDLGRELGLTSAQMERFFELLASQQAASRAEMRTRGDAPLDRAAREELTRRNREKKQANEVELAVALGGNYSKWQEYEKTLPVRQQVVAFQSALGPDAMSETQSRSLIAAIAAEQVRNQESRRSAPRLQNVEDLRRATEEDNTRLVNAAAAHLNPRQLEAYRSFLQHRQSTATAIMEIMKSPAGISRPGP